MDIYIPDCIGNLQNLNRFYLSVSQVGGILPKSLGTLKNLVELDLIDNKLYGPIPSSLGSPLSDTLQYFEIFLNKLSRYLNQKY